MSVFKSMWIAATLLTLGGCATNIPLPEKPQIQQHEFGKIPPYLSAFIEKEMKQNKIMGLSIALISGQNTVWQQGFGYANKKLKIPVSSSTLFRAGSISKFVNALAVMKLVEENRLALDLPIHAYLPELQIKSRFKSAKDITLRSILSHQSGLPSDLIRDMWVKHPPDFKTALNYLNVSYVSQPPERAYSYSNLGHDVIGMIIENVTGQDYQNYMNNFLMSLNMKNSRFSASPTEPSTALGYEKRRNKTEYSLRDIPAGGLTSSSVDLVQLVKLFSSNGQLDNKNILKSKSLKDLLVEQGKDRPLVFKKRIGLGLFYYDDVFHRKIPIVGHGGATVNHRALIKFSPGNKYGVALLSNSKNSANTLNRIANKSLFLLHEAATGTAAPKRHARWPYKKNQDIVDTEALVGHYATVAGLAKIYQKGNRLKARLAGKRFVLYQKQPGGLYYLKYRLLGIFPIKLGNIGNLGIALREVDGQKILIGQNTLGNVQLLGEKLSAVPLNAAWKKRTGKYKVVTPIEIIQLPSGGLKIVDGFLVAHARSDRGDRLEFVLKPVNNDEAIIAGIGRSLGETVFATTSGDHETLSYSNIHFRKVK